MSIKIKSLQHIAIATKQAEEVMARFRELFGLELEGEEVVETQKVKTAFFNVAGVPFELLEPTADDSPISKFLEKRGNAFHHLAVEVENLEEAVKVMKEKGVRLINETPNEGAHSTRTVFIHPKSFGGLLVELVEKA